MQLCFWDLINTSGTSLLLNSSSYAHCTVRPKKPKCRGLDVERFTAGTWKEMGGSCPQNLKLLEGFQQITFFYSLLKKQIAQTHTIYECCCKLLSHVWLCDPMDCSTPGFPVPHHLPELAQAHVHWVGDAIQPSCPLLSLLLLSSIFPSIKVFSNELDLPIRWPKYWRFSFSISPSNGYSGLTC